MANYRVTYYFTNGGVKTFTVRDIPYDLKSFTDVLTEKAFTTHIPPFSRETYIINNRNVNCVEVAPE